VGLGDAVVVTDPEFPPLLDRLDLAGARTLAVAMDDEGPIVEQLAAAVDQEPVAFFLQPRAQNPTGGGISETRAAELGAVLAGTPVIVIEDDHSGSVAGAPLVSLGQHCPGQVVHIRSFSKSHGPDLRLAAVGGAAAPIDAVTRRRRLGPSWSSRLLQQLLLSMLDDDRTKACVADASTEYARRRRLLADGLTERGVQVTAGSGFNLWIAVHDEQAALVNLAANGVGAAPGSPFRAGGSTAAGAEDAHLRVSVGPLAEGHDRVADLLAAAASAGR
ncbi:MAG: aminotransferase class I/II-fold pyridoxal phosphate-dependent enzyme, partial [Actinomycetota bacterium]